MADEGAGRAVGEGRSIQCCLMFCAGLGSGD